MRCLDIERRLNEILKKYPVFPEYNSILELVNIKAYVLMYLKSIEGNILFIANSVHDINEIVIKNGFRESAYIIVEDGLSKKEIEIKQSYEKIIYISYEQQNKWIDFLGDIFPRERVINLYEVLSNAGFCCLHEYYERHEIVRDPYANINRVKQMLNDTKVDKYVWLQKLFYLYLEIRDFSYAFKYMDHYIDAKYDAYESVQALKGKIQEFLGEVNKSISVQSGAMAMIWIDSVQYDEAAVMPFIGKEMDNSLCFDRAYTVTPYTVPTYFTLFCQKRSVQDGYNTYRKQMIDDNNSSVMKMLHENGYLFMHHGVALGLFNNDNCPYGELKQTEYDDDIEVRENIKIRKYKSYDYAEDICPVVLWNCLRDIASGRKVFTLGHIVVETHSPFVSGNFDGEYVNNIANPNTSQIDSAREYVDKQMEFYSGIWGENIKSILLSDHGKNVRLKSGKVLNDLTHTFLLVKGPEIRKRHFCGMFSYVDFDKLIELLLSDSTDKVEGLARDFVEIEDFDRYGVILVPILEEENMNFEKKTLLGYRGIRVGDDVFMRRSDGKCYYYKGHQLLNLYGLVERKKYDSLDKMTGIYQVDLSDSMFTYTRVMLKAIAQHDEETRQQQQLAEELLEKLFKTIGDREVIAFRPACETTYEILRKHAIRKNVKYIIDNSQTVENELGIEYIHEGDIKNHNDIRKIFITSYNHHSEMYEKLSEIEGIEVYDIYRYLDENGIELQEDYLSDKVNGRYLREAYEQSIKR